MACHSNAVATMDNWLSSKSSPHQMIRARMEKHITSEDRCQQTHRMAWRGAHCINRQLSSDK